MNEESREALAARLNSATARLQWRELAPHFARGAVVHVAVNLDLIEAGVAFARDERGKVQAWLEAGSIAMATDADAKRWSAEDAELWASVVAPWVLVQEAKRVSTEQKPGGRE